MSTDSVMARLRAANPYPNPPSTVQTAATARYRRPVAVFALAMIAVAVLASTAFAVSRWIASDVVRPDVTLAEYRAAQHQLPLPPGYQWPKLHVQRNSVTSRGGGGGYAVLNAEIAWDCYWVGAIRSGDTAAQQRAHAQVNDLLRNNILVAPVGAPEGWAPADPPRRPYAVFAHDGGYEWLRDTYALAAAGHPERLAQRCIANR
jgi:hypothetical protein